MARTRKTNEHNLTSSDMAILKLFVDGKSLQEIADIYNLKQDSIRARICSIKTILLPDEYRPSDARLIEYARRYIFKQDIVLCEAKDQ